MEEIKLCPVCDQSIKGHWCRSCHQFVGKPVRRNIRTNHYTANEEPTKVPFANHYREQGQPGPEESPKWKEAINQAKTRFASWDRSVPWNTNRKKGLAAIAIVYFLVLAVNILPRVIPDIPLSPDGASEGNSPWIEEVPIDASAGWEFEDGYAGVMLTQEEVLDQYDVHCNSEGHMPLTGEQAVATIKKYLLEHGCQVEVSRQDTSFNQVISYDEEEVTSFFVSDYISAYFSNQDETQKDRQDYAVFVESDTVTGEVHRVSLFFPKLGEGCQLIEELYQANTDAAGIGRTDLAQLRADLQELLQNPAVLSGEWESQGESLCLTIEKENGEFYAYLRPYD